MCELKYTHTHTQLSIWPWPLQIYESEGLFYRVLYLQKEQIKCRIM